MQDCRIFKYFVLLLYFVPLNISGQEMLVGLEGNPVLQKMGREKASTHKNFLFTDTLELPFFDDFSRETIFPDYNRWADQDVFINFTVEF